MKAKNKKITKSSKQLAATLGLSNADAIEWELRYNLTKKITEIVKKNKLTVTQVAKNSGTSRSRITRILKGDSIGISMDILIRVIASLGHSIKIGFKKVA